MISNLNSFQLFLFNYHNQKPLGRFVDTDVNMFTLLKDVWIQRCVREFLVFCCGNIITELVLIILVYLMACLSWAWYVHGSKMKCFFPPALSVFYHTFYTVILQTFHVQTSTGSIRRPPRQLLPRPGSHMHSRGLAHHLFVLPVCRVYFTSVIRVSMALSRPGMKRTLVWNWFIFSWNGVSLQFLHQSAKRRAEERIGGCAKWKRE